MKYIDISRATKMIMSLTEWVFRIIPGKLPTGINLIGYRAPRENGSMIEFAK